MRIKTLSLYQSEKALTDEHIRSMILAGQFGLRLGVIAGGRSYYVIRDGVAVGVCRLNGFLELSVESTRKLLNCFFNDACGQSYAEALMYFTSDELEVEPYYHVNGFGDLIPPENGYIDGGGSLNLSVDDIVGSHEIRLARSYGNYNTGFKKRDLIVIGDEKVNSDGVSTQGHNAYRSVIMALSEVLLDRALSGHPLADAREIIKVVEAKGKVLPVCDRTLGRYLKER